MRIMPYQVRFFFHRDVDAKGKKENKYTYLQQMTVPSLIVYV
jgi:hypothetical protein